MALVDKNKLKNKLNEKASWFDIVEFKEDKNNICVLLDNSIEKISFKVKKKTKDYNNYVIEDNSNLAFDHALVIVTGIERLRNKINYTDIVCNMMPEYFTLGGVQQV